MATSGKVLLIGIDGAPFDLVTKWVDQGKLPNLGALLRDSAHGVLESTLDVTPPAWSSIYTGKNAGKHGIFDFMHHEHGSYSFAPTNASRRNSADIWEILSKHSLKVGVLNAPVTFPVRPVNGFLVSGFLTPSAEANYTYPASLKNELKDKVPGFRPSSPNELQLNLNKDAYVKNIGEQLENLRRAALYLIKKDDYDFFGVFISETDHVQHWFWRNMAHVDESRPGDKFHEYSHVIYDTYSATDSLVGELLESIDDDTHVVLVSDHGGTELKRFFHTNYFLHSIGMLNFKTDFRTSIRRALYDRGVTQKLYQLLIKRKIFLLHYLLKPLALSVSDIDWRRTLAYSFGYGQIYLNVEGRDRFGAIPRDRVDEVSVKIMKELSKVSDPEGVERPIHSIYSKSEMYYGPHAEEAPDIQLVMSEGYEAFSWASIADGLFTESVDRNGTHNTRGIVAVKVGGIATGRLSGASVFDIAPTILHIMGVEIPPDMDGRVLDVFTPEYSASHPLKYGTAAVEASVDQYELSESEQEKIEENLRSLGYI